MKIDFPKTYDNAKRNLTKTSLAQSTTRTTQQIHNYYTGTSAISSGVNDKLIEVFEANGDEVYYIDES